MLITMDCDGRTGWYNKTKHLITTVVFEDDAIVYVKGETNVAVELASGR